jgi:hypothetical protein
MKVSIFGGFKRESDRVRYLQLDYHKKRHEGDKLQAIAGKLWMVDFMPGVYPVKSLSQRTRDGNLNRL